MTILVLKKLAVIKDVLEAISSFRNPLYNSQTCSDYYENHKVCNTLYAYDPLLTISLRMVPKMQLFDQKSQKSPLNHRAPQIMKCVLKTQLIHTFVNVVPWFFNKKHEFFLKIIHCKSADIFPV